MNLRILAIFLARGGSKRIKNKNIINFFSKPIIYYPLKEAKKSKIFSKIHISTESQKIKNKVEKLGFKIDFLRPKKLALDNVGSIEVIKFILDKYKKNNQKFDIIYNIMPASPLVLADDFIKALNIFKKNKLELPLQSFSKYPAPIEWAFSENKGIAKPLNSSLIQKPSQKFKHYYYECGPFSIFPSKIFENKDNYKFLKRGFSIYKMPISRAIDIDDKEDLQMAKILFRGQKSAK